MKFFSSNIDWTKLWWAVGIMTTFWAGLAGITVMFPDFDPYYKVVNIALGAVSTALLFAARGNKYVANRQEPPEGGKP